MKSTILPVVLCGGSGSRLWPISRESFPKQYLPFVPNNNSFLQITLKRLNHFFDFDDPIIVCNEEHRFITAEQLREINVVARSIILEPIGRNTAPAIALAALRCLEDIEDKILLVMPSDHKIDNNMMFSKTINASKDFAEEGNLIAFGISPTSPETGYGYIKSKLPLQENGLKGEKIEKFIEKPEKSLAQKFICDKKYSWNSGIYLFKASVIINELKKYSPNIVNYCEKAIKQKTNDLYFEKMDKEQFQKCSNISIDKAVMEKTKLGIVYSLNIGWSDIGGWESYWKNSKKDINGNALLGKTMAISTKNSLIRSENRLVVGLGIEDLLILETKDAVLVTKKSYSEKVKDLVKTLKEQGKKESIENTKGFRPWGSYEIIEEGSEWKVKKILVNPGASLSLQMHLHRSEHWVVASGVANVLVGEKNFKLNSNESCYVPKGTKHRLSNLSDKLLIIIEVQIGSYLKEDDIYRYDDIYGRNL